MEYRASIANPDQWLWTTKLWRFDFGAYGTLHIYVWEDRVEEALEIATDYATGRGWIGLFTELDLEEACEDLSLEGNEEPSEEEILEQATQDLTYTESGYLASYEWWVLEISVEVWEYQQVQVASQILHAHYSDAGWDVVIDTEWDPESEIWLRGYWDRELVPFIVGRLRPFCDYLLPVTMFPHFLVPNLRYPMYLNRWVVALACEQGQREAMRELFSIADELNLVTEVEATTLIDVVPSVYNWVQLARAGEGDLDPQQYALRYSIILRLKDRRYETPFEIEFAFFERWYEPALQEFED